MLARAGGGESLLARKVLPEYSLPDTLETNEGNFLFERREFCIAILVYVGASAKKMRFDRIPLLEQWQELRERRVKVLNGRCFPNAFCA